MPRRVTMPAADDLFRPTDEKPRLAAAPEPEPAPEAAPGAGPDAEDQKGARTPSGRVKHDEKMTVYVTAAELLDLEEARLTLRRAGVSVDRGRLVRAAVAMALADLDEHGAEAELVRRLSS